MVTSLLGSVWVGRFRLVRNRPTKRCVSLVTLLCCLFSVGMGMGMMPSWLNSLRWNCFVVTLAVRLWPADETICRLICIWLSLFVCANRRLASMCRTPGRAFSGTLVILLKQTMLLRVRLSRFGLIFCLGALWLNRILLTWLGVTEV